MANPATDILFRTVAAPPFPVGSALNITCYGVDALNENLQNDYMWQFWLNGVMVQNWLQSNYYFISGLAAGHYDFVAHVSTSGGATTDHTDTFTFDIVSGLYPVGGEKRYTCNGAVDISTTPAQILKSLLSCMDANAVYTSGRWKIVGGMPVNPSGDVIDESWLNGGVSFSTGHNKNALHNTAVGTFINPDDHWASSGFPTIQIPAYLSEDREELSVDLTLNWTTSGFMAQRLGRLAVERSRRGLTVTMPCNYKALGVAVDDVKLVSIERLGWSNIKCKVIDWSFSASGIDLTLGLDDSDIMGLTSGDLSPLSLPPITNLPDPWFVPPPSDLILSDEIISSSSGIITKFMADIRPAPDASVSVYEVESRTAGSDWVSMGSGLHSYIIGAIAGQVYEVRARAVNSLGSKSDYITASRLVLGLSAPPPDLTGFRINCIGTEAHLSWTPVVDIGLSHYTIKYSPLTVGASWSSSVSLVPVVSGNSVTVPAMVGTYLIKAVRYGGSESTTASMVTSTIAGIAGLNAVELFEPYPAWDGTHSNTEVFDGVLRMNNNENMSGWTTLSSVMSLGYGVTGYSATGEYQSSTVIDLGQVFTSRLTAQLFATATNTLNVMAGWTRLSDVVALSGAGPGEWDITLQVSYTSDDPALDNWSGWQEFVVGDYAARAFKFRLLLYSYRSYLLVQVAQLSVNIDMPDRVLSLQDVVCPAAGMRVTFDPPFRALKGLATDGQDMVTGDYKTITNKDESGFNIRFYNASAAGIERTFDVLATGYGTQEV